MKMYDVWTCKTATRIFMTQFNSRFYHSTNALVPVPINFLYYLHFQRVYMLRAVEIHKITSGKKQIKLNFLASALGVGPESEKNP